MKFLESIIYSNLQKKKRKIKGKCPTYYGWKYQNWQCKNSIDLCVGMLDELQNYRIGIWI